MNINFENHPCFNEKARHTSGRIHLPVALKCNVQCNFCNRKSDCVAENRPGVTSTLLSPMNAVVYLNRMLQKIPNISVVGIAGPGDPFANPDETMSTLRLVRDLYPDLMLCVATNGLNILPYVDELAELKVSHITITLNAVDPEISAKIYSWVRFEKRTYLKGDGASLLLANQLAAIMKLKRKGITVKINSIIIPGINEDHITEVAQKAGSLGADLFNAIPIYPVENTPFYTISPPPTEKVNAIRKEAANYIKQMNHCTRCRADAVGLLGQDLSAENIDELYISKLLNDENKTKTGEEKFIAVASMEGMLVNQHLGEASQLLIYRIGDGKPELIETRETPSAGSGMQRWIELADKLKDCSSLLVSGVGNNPSQVLKEKGIKIFVIEGIIDTAIKEIINGSDINHLLKRKEFVCRQDCSGDSTGCG
jgi:nitrogen fixation protein NifB